MFQFHRTDISKAHGFVNFPRYRRICTALTQCKGAAQAVFDGRVMAKQVGGAHFKLHFKLHFSLRSKLWGCCV